MCRTIVEIKDKLGLLRAMAMVHGAACAEMWDGQSMVWVEATRSKHNRINWTVEERRIARADIPQALGLNARG